MSGNLADELRSLHGKPRWDRNPGASFERFSAKFEDYLVQKSIAGFLFHDKLGLSELTIDSEAGKLANAMTFATLRQAIPEDLMDEITAECDAEDAAEEEPDGSKLLKNNSKILWSKVVVHSHGAIAATAGYDLQNDIRSWVFPVDPQLTYVERVTTAIAQQTALVRRAAALKDALFPHTQGQACAAIIADLPPILEMQERAYRAFRTLPSLAAELKLDAAKYDRKPELVALMAQLSGGTVLAADAGRRGGGAAPRRPYVKADHARRKNKDLGPPWPGSIWCEMHGWCGHGQAKCTKGKDKEHKTSTPTALVAAAAAAAPGTPIFKQNANGDFERILMFTQMRTHATIAAPSPTRASPEAVLASAALNQSVLYPGSSITYVDCGGSISIVNSQSTEGCDQATLVHFPQPRPIAGIGEGVLATGSIERCLGIKIPGVSTAIGIRFPTYICPDSDYEIVATNTKGLCGSGISSKQDAQLPGGPLVLEAHHIETNLIENKLWCVPYNGLYALPTVPIGDATITYGPAQLIQLDNSALFAVAPCPAVPIGGGIVVVAPHFEPLSAFKAAVPQAKPVLAAVPIGGVITAAATTHVRRATPFVPIGGIVTSILFDATSQVPIGGVIAVAAPSPLLEAKLKVPLGGSVCVAPTNKSDTSYADLEDATTVSTNKIVEDSPPPPPSDKIVARFSKFASRFAVSDTVAAQLAARTGTKLSHKTTPDAIAYKNAVQISNQCAVPVKPVHGTLSSDPTDLSFGVDTLGGKFERSHEGNHFAIVICDHADGKRCPTVATFATHHAANTVQALSTWLAASKFPLKLDGTLQPHIHCYVDNGTELQGVFKSLLEKHGVQMHHATAYKHDTARTGFIENANRELQRRMRINLAAAAANFRAFDFSPALFWDRALKHSSKQMYVQNIIKGVDKTDSNACATARAIADRLLPYPFGAIVAGTLQLGSPMRSTTTKQLSNRAVPSLFLGIEPDGRSVLLLSNGNIAKTIDVRVMATDPADGISQLTTEELRQLGDTIANAAIDNFDKSDDTFLSVQIPTLDHGIFAHVNDRVDIFWSAENKSFPGRITDYCANVNIDAKDGEPYDGPPVAAYHVAYDDTASLWHKIDDASNMVRVLDCHNVATATETVAITKYHDDAWPKVSALNYDPITEFYTGLFSGYGSSDCTTVNSGVAFAADDPTVLAARPFKPHHSVEQFIDIDTGQISTALLNGDIDLPPMPALPNYKRSTTADAPNTTRQALESEDAIYWLHGMIKEHVGHIRTPTFKYVDLVESTEARDGLQARWVFTHKWNGNNIDVFRSRLVLAGYDRTKGVHYVDTYLSAPPIDTMRFMECIAVLKQWLVYETDLTRAYAHSTAAIQPNGHPVSARMPNISRTYTSKRENGIQAIRSMYGFPAAGYEFGLWFTEQLLSEGCPFRFRQNRAQPCLYSAEWPPGHGFAGEYYIVYVHSDNVLHYTSSATAHREFMGWYRDTCTITGGESPLNEQPPTTRLGMTVTYTANSVNFAMPAYVEKLLAAHNMADCNPCDTPLPPGFHLVDADKPVTLADQSEVTATINKTFGFKCRDYHDTVRQMASTVQGINWFATMVCAGLRCPISLIATASHAPSVKSVRAAKQILRWCKRKQFDGLTYTRNRVYGKHEFPRQEYSSDASFNDHADSGKSQGGVIGRLDGNAAHYFTSRRSGHVCTSTTHAEIYFGSEAARQLNYEQQMCIDLRFLIPLPARIEMDNRPALIDAGSIVRRFSQRQKHYFLCERYLHQQVEAKLIFLQHKNGALLDADLMTKSLPKPAMLRHIHTIENGYHVPGGAAIAEG